MIAPCSGLRSSNIGNANGRRAVVMRVSPSALAGLVALLYHDQQEERNRFYNTLDDFCSPQIARAVEGCLREFCEN